MATQSDSKVIDRESTNRSLADRYLSGQAAGGAYQPVQKTVKTEGTNELAVQNSINDTKYTSTKGFKLRTNNGIENFNEAALNYSDTINGGVRTTGIDKIATNWNGAGSKAALYTTTGGGFHLMMNVSSWKVCRNGGSALGRLALVCRDGNAGLHGFKLSL
jgi:hypothetical protein